MSDRAVHIDGFSAAAADEVVVVVASAILVAGRGAGGLDSADQSFFRKQRNGVVYRLPRDRPDLRPYLPGNIIRRGMRPTRHRPQHGKTLRCHGYQQGLCPTP